jgi:hypothetical protein
MNYRARRGYPVLPYSKLQISYGYGFVYQCCSVPCDFDPVHAAALNSALKSHHEMKS